MQNNLTKSKLITINALLCAIVTLFIFIPISIGPLQLAFIPIIAVIISAEFMGLKNGIFTGLFFGMISLINQFIRPGLLAQAFYNPLISIIPRMLIGVSAYYSAHALQKLFPKIPDAVSYGVGSACGVITNTALVCGMILLFHFGKTFGTLTIGWQWMLAIITGNFIIELAICIIVTPPIIIALKKSIIK